MWILSEFQKISEFAMLEFREILETRKFLYFSTDYHTELLKG